MKTKKYKKSIRQKHKYSRKHKHSIHHKHKHSIHHKHKIKHKIKHKQTRNKSRKGGNKNFIKAQCAPSTKDKMQKFSCYDKKSLLKMRDLWNKRHLESPINSSEPMEIWNHLKKKMEKSCYSESCWLKQKFMENNLDDKLNKYTFAPKSPEKWKKNHNTWLNSVDIENVMKQYEHTFPCFRFIGPTPIDFDTHIHEDKCVWDDLCQFKLSNFIKDGVNKIGIIFNTDPHNKSGAHWISLFINIKEKYIFFFDSNGTKIPKEIKEFSNRVISQGLELDIKLKLDQNAPFVHQEGNTECGMYSLYFIISLIEDTVNPNYFKSKKISDAEMENLRDRYFNSDL